jgi:uncharacterized protein YndB with AHSA1/START domain
MMRRLLAIALAVIPVAFALDRWLAHRRGVRPPEPLRMLVIVDAPIEQTWAVIADVPLQPEWMREMKRLEMDAPGPVRAGSRGTATVRILGISVSDPVEIVKVEPPVRYVIRHDGTFRGGGVITLEPGADGSTTIVRWEETLVPPVLPELGALLQAPILRAVFQADLERLKRLVETGSADG